MASNDFTEEQKITIKPHYKQIGRSGTLVIADQVENDYLNELKGIEGQTIYYNMLLSDSQIRKLYHAVSNPIRSANWDIEPASDDEKDLKAAALMKEILFNDIPDGFSAKLDEILTFPWHGHAVFEVIHKNRTSKNFGPYTGLANLAFRDQQTLYKWKFNSDGILEAIHQRQAGTIVVNEIIPAENLLIFYNEKKGNDIGFPFCRMVYGNYKRKKLYKQLQAIGMEKGAIGTPQLTLPTGVDYNSEEYNSAVDQLEAYTLAENSYIILPNGYELKLDLNSSFDPGKSQIAIKAENEEIVGSLIGMFLEMGIGGNSGNQAGTQVSSDFFTDGIEYIADKIRDKINNSLIPNLMALNFGDTYEVLPKLTHSGIADEVGKELMEIVTGYTKEGVITIDEQLEDFVRKAHNLPKKVEGELIDNQETKDKIPADKKEVIDPTDVKDTVEMSIKKKSKSPVFLIETQAEKIANNIKEAINFSSAKFINDVMAKYNQLPEGKKQNATNKVVMCGVNKLRKGLKRSLTETVSLAIEEARKEIPSKKDVELSSKENDNIRILSMFDDKSEIKLNDYSKLPAHIQVLIAKQADLISTASLEELREKLSFSYSSMELKSSDPNVIRQAMQEDADSFSNKVQIKGTNVSSLMVNEGRSSFFFDDDVLDEIHSFTFMNEAPKSAICRELAGTTFNNNDAESLRYSPPLHHNCKSYLRANLKESKGVEKLDVSSLSPSADAKKSITL